MNKNKYTFMEGLMYKVLLVMLFASTGIVNVIAGNTVQMDAFSIKPGETKVVAVNLNNSDALTSLQMDLTLPAGLSCTAIARNESRLGHDEDNRYEQSVTLTPSQTNSNVYGVTILTNNGTPFVDNSGALVYLTIKAAGFNTSGTIKIQGIIGSDSPKSGLSNKYLIASSTATVAPQVAKVSTSESSFSIKSDGTLKEIDVQLNNDITLYGLQADITLPAEMSIDTKSNGDFHFYYTDRLPQSFSIGSSVLSSQKVRVAIASPSHEAITGKSGTLFSFKVKAGETLVENSNIIIDNVIVSDTNDVAYNLLQSDTINVTNQTIADNGAKKAANDTANTKLTAVIAAVQVKFDAAKTKIATDYKNVADKFVTVEDSIQKVITFKTDSVKAKHDAVELTAESTVNTADVEAAITKLIADATAAEKALSILGDVNGDGFVKVNDYNAIKNIVLEIAAMPEVGTKEFYAADVKADQVINIGDVTAIIKIINNVSTPASGAKTMRTAFVAATADAISLSAEGEGNTRRIAINLSNSISYVGCQMDIKLPAGVTLLGESLSSRANGHTLSSNDLSNGLHRILVSDISNNEFGSNEGAFVYLDVAVTGNSSVDDIVVSNILFTDADASIYHFAELSNSTTGINTVMSESNGSKIYSVGGKLMNTIQKGVNIIRNADGSTKKILKK